MPTEAFRRALLRLFVRRDLEQVLTREDHDRPVGGPAAQEIYR